jgi:hypothetical protein
MVSCIKIRNVERIFRLIGPLVEDEVEDFSTVYNWDGVMSSYVNEPGLVTLWLKPSTYYDKNHGEPMVVSAPEDLRRYGDQIVLRTEVLVAWNLRGSPIPRAAERA